MRLSRSPSPLIWLLHSSSSKPRVNPSPRRAEGSPPRDEDEVADGAEAPQDGGAGAQARQPQAEAEAEAEAEAGGEGRPPRAQEAPHRLLLLHVCPALRLRLVPSLLPLIRYGFRVCCVTALPAAQGLASLRY